MESDKIRNLMVKEQLMARGINDPRVLDAFFKVPRHDFVALELVNSAYEDCPLPIGSGQTISQPYMVALMTELLALKGHERVLELGTGSGYQSAILAELAKEIYSVERIEKLAASAQQRLKELGYQNIYVHLGDGTMGLDAFKPYDAIIVTAGAPEVPSSLVEQLKDGGRLVIPIGGRFMQTLVLLEKKGQEVVKKEVCGCVFVPLVGEKGWKNKIWMS